ncbi:uncharacterized protein K02A2.6-like [Armigeres subalbatus]|uniref:uncharacterized protein K02A2.6-like n=1 Tax=Armigeres subalbatus TaxID=124917 RepID=UPI002ED228C5
MPTKAWSHLCADFLGPLPNGKFIFVMVDFYSRYVVVEIMTKITSAAVIQRLEQIFTRLGLPDVLKTDNAANFCSQEFRDYCTDNGIKLTHTTPYWPAANGEVERQNRSLLKILKISQLTGADMNKDLQDYIYMYTVTPHTVTGVSPAELMFGRRFRDKFPHIGEEELVEDEVKDRDWINKYNSKLYRDVKVRARESDIQIGDDVILKNQHRDNKLAPNFIPRPAVVLGKKGNSYVVQTEAGTILRRNYSHLKPIQRNIATTSHQPGNDTIDDSAVSEPVHDRDQRQHSPSPGPSTEVTEEPPTTRPKRNIILPKKYHDYQVDLN